MGCFFSEEKDVKKVDTYVSYTVITLLTLGGLAVFLRQAASEIHGGNR